VVTSRIYLASSFASFGGRFSGMSGSYYTPDRTQKLSRVFNFVNDPLPTEEDLLTAKLHEDYCADPNIPLTGGASLD
jgi:hypothetical protein